MAEETMKTYHVAYERDESGWWVASVRELRGCHTQAKSLDKLCDRIREAIELCREVRRDEGLPLTIESREIEVPAIA